MTATQDDVLGYFDTLSNWGRWGDEDERGTLNHIISVWSPASDGNNTAAMQASIPAAAGLSGTDTWSSLSSAQQQAFVQAYAAREGYHGN